MNALPLTEKVATIVMALYGLACLAGGIIGYLKAGSTASLAAGVPSGILLLLCAAGMFWQPVWSLIGAVIVTLAVGGFFTSNLVKHWDEIGTWSGGPRTIAMAAGGLLVLITAGIALATRGQPPGP
jgi:uncharacterized membrane protein (UPF0136 family)